MVWPGRIERVLADDLVADAAAGVVEVARPRAPDPLFLDETPHVRVVLRMLGGGRRHGMIQYNRQPLGVEDACLAQRGEQAGNGGGVIVAEYHVGTGVDDLAHHDVLQPGRPRQRLLRKCISHLSAPCGIAL